MIRTVILAGLIATAFSDTTASQNARQKKAQMKGTGNGMTGTGMKTDMTGTGNGMTGTGNGMKGTGMKTDMGNGNMKTGAGRSGMKSGSYTGPCSAWTDQATCDMDTINGCMWKTAGMSGNGQKGMSGNGNKGKSGNMSGNGNNKGGKMSGTGTGNGNKGGKKTTGRRLAAASTGNMSGNMNNKPNMSGNMNNKPNNMSGNMNNKGNNKNKNNQGTMTGYPEPESEPKGNKKRYNKTGYPEPESEPETGSGVMCCNAYNSYCLSACAGMTELEYCKVYGKMKTIPGCSQNTRMGKCVGPMKQQDPCKDQKNGKKCMAVQDDVKMEDACYWNKKAKTCTWKANLKCEDITIMKDCKSMSSMGCSVDRKTKKCMTTSCAEAKNSRSKCKKMGKKMPGGCSFLKDQKKGYECCVKTGEMMCPTS